MLSWLTPTRLVTQQCLWRFCIAAEPVTDSCQQQRRLVGAAWL